MNRQKGWILQRKSSNSPVANKAITEVVYTYFNEILGSFSSFRIVTYDNFM